MYNRSDTYYAGGSFSITAKDVFIGNDEYIPVDVSNKYTLSYYIKTDNENARYYDMLRTYDVDKKEITDHHVMWVEGSTTKLAKDLKKGDTVVYLEDASGFNVVTTQYYQHGFIFWDYTNSKGYTYEPETYSRNYYDRLWDDGSAIDKTNNTITLKNPWTYATKKAGTFLSQHDSGATFTYLNANYGLTKDTWTKKTGTILGVGKNNEGRKFREGTAFVKTGWRIPYQAMEQTTTKLSTISLTQNANISDLDSEIEQITAISDNKYTKKGVLSFANGNELTLGETQTLANTKAIWIGYRSAANTFKELVNSYYFCNGNGEKLADIYAKHFIGTLNGDASTVNGHTVDSDVPSDAKFTDTTYSAFRGTEGMSDGTSGLVPAPKVSEFGNSYALSSDGKWRDFGQTFVSQSFADGAYATNDALENAIKELKKYVDTQSSGGVTLDSVYPVGSIYISVNDSFNPNDVFPGTWVSFGKGRTLVGVDRSDLEFQSSEDTGGEKTHTLTVEELPAHDHGAITTVKSKSLTGKVWNFAGQGASNGPGNSTSGVFRKGGDANCFYPSATKTATGISDGFTLDATHDHTASTVVGNTGSGTAHNNMMPYITVYMWKRTA